MRPRQAKNDNNLRLARRLAQTTFSFRSNIYPIFFLALICLFLGSAFSSVSFEPLISSPPIQKVIYTSPTPTPQAHAEDIKPSKQASLSLPEVDSDLDFVSFRYHSWDIPDEISYKNDLWIEVDLTNQILYAYRDNQIINGFKISSGTGSYPTVTGTYKIFSKYPAIRMTGPGYDLPDVPYTMFFYKGYALHGTYWHNNFGTPMSHGCVNMETKDAFWIYENAPVGTYIMVHY